LALAFWGGKAPDATYVSVAYCHPTSRKRGAFS
jgi:hypothetical protein